MATTILFFECFCCASAFLERYFIQSSQQSSEELNTHHFMDDGTQTQRGYKTFHGTRVSKWQSQDLNPGLTPASMLLIIPLLFASSKGAISLISKPFLTQAASSSTTLNSCSVLHYTELRGLDTNEEKRKARADTLRCFKMGVFGKRDPDFCKEGKK